MNKNTKLSLVASALLSLSVFGACVPVAIDIPDNVNQSAVASAVASAASADPSAAASIASASPSTIASAIASIASSIPVTPTAMSTATATVTARPTATATATATASPTATSTTYGNGSGGGSVGGGGGGGVVSSSPTVNIVSRTPDATNTGTNAGIFGDTLTISGTNLSGTVPSLVFYQGPNYQGQPTRSVSRTVSYATNTGSAATLLIPNNLSNEEINTILGRASTTAVTDADRQSLRANVVVTSSGGGAAQSGPVGSGGF